MAIPIKANYTGATPTSLGEFAAGDSVPVANGGTGATTVSAALAALGGAPLASPSFTGTFLVNGAGNMPGYKNLIINGSCRVAQRGAVTLASGGSATYGGADRIWGAYIANSGTATLQQTGSVTNSVSKKSQVIVCTGMNTTSGSSAALETYIEAKSVEHLNSKTVTFSCRVGSSLPAGTTVKIGLLVPTGGVADTWASGYGTALSETSPVAISDGMLLQQSFTLGASDATKGLAVRVSAVFPTNASWTGSFQVTDWQLVEGSAVSAFEMPPVALEEAQCFRFACPNNGCVGYANTTTQLIIPFAPKTAMRPGTPTVTLLAGTSAFSDVGVALRNVSAPVAVDNTAFAATVAATTAAKWGPIAPGTFLLSNEL